jgi:hypothetical protein
MCIISSDSFLFARKEGYGKDREVQDEVETRKD